MSELDDRIVASVYETARGLHRIGLIDKRRMAHYDELCLSPVPDYKAAEIEALRERLKLSQASLAEVMSVSPSTVRRWELGASRPNGLARRLLDILDRNGLETVLG